MSDPKEYKITITVKGQEVKLEPNEEIENDPTLVDHILQMIAQGYHAKLMQNIIPKIQLPPGRMN